MSGTNDSFNNYTCVVCYKNVDIYSVGMCEHPVCYECSTRMRVLCRQNECPICRQDLPKVVFTREIKPYHCLTKGNLLDNQYDIYFDSPDIQEKFNELLANTCSMCKEKPAFGSFNSLKDHMRQRHELHYCDLCVENLKIFSHERRCYTRSNLAQHRRKGDVDDKSHKGHPLCEFCDQRYMDNDELYRHLRRDHLYCHFCDADGLHQYYSSYDYLRDHFRQEHYLCEEGVCAEEKFTSVFRTDIDLKAHKASVHGKQLSKAAAKQARTLELEFTLAPRGDGRMNRRGMLSASTSRRDARDYNNGRDYGTRDYQGATAGGSNPFASNSEPTFVRQPSVDVQSTDEFPTLGNAIPVVPTLAQAKGRGNVTIRSTVRNQPLAVTDENFPALGLDSAGPGISKTVNFSVSSSGNASASGIPQCQKASTSSNVSIQVNHEPNGTVTTRVSGPNIRIRPAQLSIDSEFPEGVFRGGREQFPALGNSEPSTSSTANLTQWKEVLQWTCSKSTPPATVSSSAPKSKSKVAPPPLASSPPPIQSGEDFPSLSRSSKLKKQSVITVVPTWGQGLSQTGSTSNNGNNAKATSDPTKGKTKKKKVKQQTSNGNSSSGNESGSSKSNANTTVARKDVEQSARACDSSNSSSRVSFKDSGGSSRAMISSHYGINNGASNGDSKGPTSVQEQLQQHTASKRESRKKSKSNNVVGGGGTGATTVGMSAEFGGNDERPPPTANNGLVTQRKRSELKINNLNNNNNVYQQPENFPALGICSGGGGITTIIGTTTAAITTTTTTTTTITGAVRPPGFTNPPPGFGSPATTALPPPPPPPPGFSVKYNNIERLHGSNGLTFTNSSGESYSILPPPPTADDGGGGGGSHHAYASPPDFQKRNACLVARLNEVLVQQDKIDKFRYVSGLFRGGTCDAEEYYSHCREVMGAGAFASVFPELLALLPDIGKQRELFKVHRREVGGKPRGLEMCATCGQVLKNGTDFRTHMSSHTLENHFPALGKGNAPPPPRSTTWVRK